MKLYRTFHCITALTLWGAASLLAAAPPGALNVMDYGAVADGKTLNTEAIADAIEACEEQGGGTVYFPAGQYLTGSIHMESNLTLYLAQGAEILYSGDPEHSPLVESRWEGTTAYIHSPLIYANGKKNIAIKGHGTLNGQGEKWWWRNGNDPKRKDRVKPWLESWRALFKEIHAGKSVEKDDFQDASKYLRPSLVVPFKCENVVIEGVTMKDSPMWTLHLVYSENIQVSGVSFLSTGSNGDGITIDSSRNVRVSDCFFNTSDDCIVIKSGRDEDGRRIGRPSESITITNCVMNRGNGGVVVGSEMSGDVRDVTASNIVCYGTKRGIRIKTGRGRGGVVENLRFNNWVIHDAPDEAIQLTTRYVNIPEEPVTERTPIIRNVAISNVTVNGAERVINIAGLEEQPIEGIRLSDIRGKGDSGFVCELARNLALHDVRIESEEGLEFRFSDSSDLHLDNLGSYSGTNEPIITLNNTQDVWLHGSRAVKGNDTFVQILGSNSRNIILSDNDLSGAKTGWISGPDVTPGSVIEK